MQDTADCKNRQSDDRCRACIQIEKAFVKNDLGEPDFDGHRRAHLQLIEAEKVMSSYKHEATKKFIGWFVTVLLGAVSGGVIVFLQGGMK